MHYRVRARFREETAGEFQRVLRDGTIAAQQPDGQEIVDGHPFLEHLDRVAAGR